MTTPDCTTAVIGGTKLPLVNTDRPCEPAIATPIKDNATPGVAVAAGWIRFECCVDRPNKSATWDISVDFAPSKLTAVASTAAANGFDYGAEVKHTNVA